MKLKYTFVTSRVADKTVAVAVNAQGGKKNSIIKMNETGAFIFELLKNDITEQEIIAKLLEEYEGATLEEIEQAVKAFIKNLKKADVLE